MSAIDPEILRDSDEEDSNSKSSRSSTSHRKLVKKRESEKVEEQAPASKPSIAKEPIQNQ